MSIDIKTLRIGSHVCIDGKRVRVDEILTVRLDGQPIRLTVSRNNLVDGFPSLEEIEPIEITPELLEELGFKCTDKGRIKDWWKDFFCLTYLNVNGCFDFGAIRIEYLHELESLYYLIYETELIQD